VECTLPFVKKVDGIWSQTLCDSHSINLTPASKSGFPDLGPKKVCISRPTADRPSSILAKSLKVEI